MRIQTEPSYRHTYPHARTYSHNWVAGRNALLSFILMDIVSVFSSFS